MKALLFLGTGAADGINAVLPKDFENKDFRRCSATLLGGKILLDCGPHIFNSLVAAKVSETDITDIVLTHLHPDHFDVESVNRLARINPQLRLWCREDSVFDFEVECEICKMNTFCEYNIGGFKFTGVPANHAQYPQHLSIEKDGKKLFYGLDGAWFLGETVEFMKNKQYDIFVLDATVGDYTGDYRMGEHNSIPMIRLMADSMKTLDIINQNTTVVLSHLAMCLHKTHEQTCDTVKADGFLVAFDGMKLEF